MTEQRLLLRPRSQRQLPMGLQTVSLTLLLILCPQMTQQAARASLAWLLRRLSSMPLQTALRSMWSLHKRPSWPPL